MHRRQFDTLLAALIASGAVPARAQPLPPWSDILAKARGQTVYWNAWAGDEKTNEFIAWVGEQTKAQYGVSVQHVRLKDTAEAVTKVVAEKAAGRNDGGGVDMIWLNGPNFLTMKQQNLLHGPVTSLPNLRFVDTTRKRSNVIDFTTPVEGLAVPWRIAQIVFVVDSARIKNPADLPRSASAMLEWARKNPGRLTHPNVANFLGSTFLKQALVDLVPDDSVLQRPATDADFATVTAPLWTWYEALRPHLWRKGEQFPENGAAQRQLLNDGEIDIAVSFNPSEAAVSAQDGLLPATVRTFGFTKGTIGNTSFVAIPYNAAHKEGALVVANHLLEPAVQARAEDVKQIGAVNVLDRSKLSPEQQQFFDKLPGHPALPSAAELGSPRLEPHASWMTRIAAEWGKRTTR